MKTGVLLILSAVAILCACSSHSPSGAKGLTGPADASAAKYQDSRFVMDADYRGAETALHSGAMQVSLDVLDAIRNRNVKEALAIAKANKISLSPHYS